MGQTGPLHGLAVLGPAGGSSALHAVVRAPGAATAAPTTISGDLNQNVLGAALGADGLGGALAAFIRPDETATRIWVTQYDANPPVLSDVSAPANVEVGVPAPSACRRPTIGRARRCTGTSATDRGRTGRT